MKMIADGYRLLADETRLRALRLLLREELNAGELTRILGLAQSAVSRQVTQLRDAGLITDRRRGRFVYFAAAERGAALERAWPGLAARLSEADDPHGDLARLDDVRRERREGQVAADGRGRRPYVPGRSWAAWARALTWLVSDRPRVLDLGCGDGRLTLELARFAGSVVGIDRREAVLRQARTALERAGVEHVELHRADLHDLPLADATFDLAVLSQSLHHAGDPRTVLSEAARVLAPGGRVLVLDLQPHTETWVHERLGHVATGFDPTELTALLSAAGFVEVSVERLPGRPDDPFRPLLAFARRPSEAQA